MGPRVGLGGVQKIAPSLEFLPWTGQPVASRYLGPKDPFSKEKFFFLNL